MPPRPAWLDEPPQPFIGYEAMRRIVAERNAPKIAEQEALQRRIAYAKAYDEKLEKLARDWITGPDGELLPIPLLPAERDTASIDSNAPQLREADDKIASSSKSAH